MPKSRHKRRRADGTIARRRLPHPLASAYRESEEDGGERLAGLLLDLIDADRADAEIDKASSDLEPDEAASILTFARDLAHEVETDFPGETGAAATGTLFALAIGGPDDALTEFLADRARVAELERSFRRAGIAAANSEIVLLPQAVDPLELAAWSVRDIQTAAFALTEAASRRALAEGPEAPVAAARAGEGGGPAAATDHRILLGLRLFPGEGDAGDAIEGAPQDEDEADSFDAALDAWMRVVNQEVMPQGLGIVGAPSTIDAALLDVAMSMVTRGLLSRLAAAGAALDEEGGDRVRHIHVSGDRATAALRIRADTIGGHEATTSIPFPLVHLRMAGFFDVLEDLAEEALTIEGEV